MRIHGHGVRFTPAAILMAILFGGCPESSHGPPGPDDDSAAGDDDGDDDTTAEPYDRFNPPYPRIGLMTWSGAYAEWYAKFDFVAYCSTSSSFAESVHAINPNTLVVSVVEDWNCYEPRWTDGYSSDWASRTSQGEMIGIYGGACHFSDMTDYCPLVDGIRYNDQIVEVMTTYVDLAVWDGVFSDGIWENPYAITDIDLDRNCPANGGSGDPDTCNDFVEHGEGWVEDVWLDGVHKTCSAIRDRIGDKILMINSGRFHEFEWETTNGLYSEHSGCQWSFSYGAGLYDEWKEIAPEPHVYLIGANRADHQADFAFLRFHLGQAAYSEGYLEVTDGGSGEHYYVSYYDEFDLDLGYPTGPMVQIKDQENGEGTFVRFFDKGAVLLSASHEPDTISDAEIAGLEGYAGPYYRFQGGQDPVMNDGQLFDSVTLNGRTGYDPNCYIGDGLLLVEEPTTAVSDILIDNDDPDTSPGSDPVELVGSWSQACSDGSAVADDWDQGCRGYAEYWGLAYSTTAGDTATFRPSIGVTGSNAVYEWHGQRTDADEESAVPVEIVHAGGTETLTLDHSQNIGQWNLLGTYTFDAATSGHVRFQVPGSATVIADAVKFVFVEPAS